MSGLNKVLLQGRLGRDAELKYLATGTPVCTFSIATSEKYKDQEKTEWHRIVCYAKTAERCAELTKGALVFVDGKLHTRSWEDKQTGSKRSVTEIVAFQVFELTAKKEHEQEGDSNPRPDDDVPF